MRQIKKKGWITELFEDERGHTSIKPVVACMGSIFLCVTMVVTSFFPKEYMPMPELVNAVMVITLVGLGSDTVDKFSHKGLLVPDPNIQDPNQPDPNLPDPNQPDPNQRNPNF